MKIAVDTRIFADNNNGRYSFYLLQLLHRITADNTADEFFLFTDRPYEPAFSFGKNVTIVTTGPKTSNVVLLKIWYDLRIPALLKKYGVDVFVTGPGICSLTTRVPQCMVIDDLSFLHTATIKKSALLFWRRYVKKCIHKAESIITVSAHLQNEVIASTGINAEKITVIHGAGGLGGRAAEETREVTREQYASGKNYFLFAGDIDQRSNIVRLLKAFSIFKKRQKSDWKLVLAGHIFPRFKHFAKQLATYRYRADVVLLNDAGTDTIAKLTAAAYAFIYVRQFEGWSTSICDPLLSGVPVITLRNSAMTEIADGAALLVDEADHKDIAEKMMLLYKDEVLRKNLIDKGKAAVAQLSWEGAAAKFMDSIRKTIPQKKG